MAILSPDAKKNLAPLINGFGYVLAVSFTIALACKFILSGYPPIIAWMEPWNEFIIVLGAAAIGIVAYENNRLVK